MADFKPNSTRAQKKFPGMRINRAMTMDRIDHLFRTGGVSGRTNAINKLNSVSSKGSQSGGFNNAEMKLANAWYKKQIAILKAKTKAKTSGKGAGGSVRNATIGMGFPKPELVKIKKKK
tara:strand:+ start:209 stop:565 length:357 start_codon:yes stop_codon:yes gene_type:complete